MENAAEVLVHIWQENNHFRLPRVPASPIDWKPESAMKYSRMFLKKEMMRWWWDLRDLDKLYNIKENRKSIIKHSIGIQDFRIELTLE